MGMPDGSSKIPKLFTPLKIRGLQMQNRIALSPLCQYSARMAMPQTGSSLTWVASSSAAPV